MGLEKIGSKIANVFKAGVKSVEKGGVKVAENVSENVAKNTLEVANNQGLKKAATSVEESIFKYFKETPEFKPIEKLIDGEVVKTTAKNAKASAEIFNGQAALDFATGIKSNKSAASSATIFKMAGKTSTEKALDEAARKQDLIAKMGEDKWEQHLAKKSQNELKAKLMEKHGAKLGGSEIKIAGPIK